MLSFKFQVGKNQPDKDGNMELYLFKNDLTKEFRTGKWQSVTY